MYVIAWLFGRNCNDGQILFEIAWSSRRRMPQRRVNRRMRSRRGRGVRRMRSRKEKGVRRMRGRMAWVWNVLLLRRKKKKTALGWKMVMWNSDSSKGVLMRGVMGEVGPQMKLEFCT